MRALTFLLCTGAALVSLRPVSDCFRETGQANPVRAVYDPAESPAAIAIGASIRSAAAVEVPLRPETILSIDLARNDEGQDQLVMAIKKELKRLGYYDGPIDADWSGSAYRAAKKFTGLKRSKPTQQLLTALRAASPAAHAARRESPAPAATQKRRKAAAAPPEAARNHTGETGVLSEGYLPPWEALRGDIETERAGRSG